MVLALIIIASWILTLSVIVGLCLSARQGDLRERGAASAYTTSNLAKASLLPASEPAAPASIPPRITTAPPVISRRITVQPSRRAYPCNPAGFPSSATG
jgi:hypothetical protein